MALRTSSPTSPVDNRYDVLKQGPSQKTLLITGAVLAALVYILPNKKEGETSSVTPKNQMSTQEIQNKHVFYEQVLARLGERLEKNPQYVPNDLEKDVLAAVQRNELEEKKSQEEAEMERVRALFEEVEQ